jgi:MSHA biogenesis protein MshN
MSLVTQMVRDLESDNSKTEAVNNEAVKKIELPLFAAANLLYGKNHQPTAERARLIMLVALLLALVLLLFDRVLLPPQYKHKLSGEVDDNALAADRESLEEADFYRDNLVIELSDDALKIVVDDKSNIAKETEIKRDESAFQQHQINNQAVKAAWGKDTNKDTNEDTNKDANKRAEKETITKKENEDRLKDNEKPAEQLVLKKNRPLSAEAIDIRNYEKAMTLLAKKGAIAAIDYLGQHQEKTILDIERREFFKSAILYSSLLIETQNFSQAELSIIQYHEAHPSNNNFSKLRIRLAMAQQKFSQAIQLLDAFSVPIDSDAEFTALRAVIHQAQGQYIDAQQAYKQLLQSDNSNARWWMGLAVAFDSSADFGSAEQAYQQVLLSAGSTSEHNAYALRRISDISR